MQARVMRWGPRMLMVTGSRQYACRTVLYNEEIYSCSTNRQDHCPRSLSSRPEVLRSVCNGDRIAVTAHHDSGIIDQNVKLAKVLVDLPNSIFHVLGIRRLDFERQDIGLLSSSIRSCLRHILNHLRQVRSSRYGYLRSPSFGK